VAQRRPELRTGLGVALPAMPPRLPNFSDVQLRALFVVGSLVDYSERDAWLRAVVKQLPYANITDAALNAVLLGLCDMTNQNVIDRLRARINETQQEGHHELAADLRLALEMLVRLDRDVQLTRQTRPKISA
jgi:hypothetical protein